MMLATLIFGRHQVNRQYILKLSSLDVLGFSFILST